MTQTRQSRRGSGQSLTDDQQSTLAQLQAQPKRKIMIPKDPLNPKDKVSIVGINGVIYAIPRGKEFEVPESVYDVWIKSYNKTQAALERIRITEMGEDDRDIEIRR